MSKQKQDRPDKRNCQWCNKVFSPLSYRHRFCSDGCSTTFHNHKAGRYISGPCPVCNEMFSTRTKNKIYCSMQCYTQSDQFKAMQAANREKINPKQNEPRICKACGKEYPRGKRTKFCSRICHRKYFAERFDRWIANPENVALPQNYDEFLARDILTCPVAGCEWEGESLGNHVNFEHGITASEFKKLCGFNHTTGLVGQELSAFFAERAKQMLEAGLWSPIDGSCRVDTKSRPRELSLEAKEHAMKTRAELPALRNVFYPCLECGAEVQQPMMGQKLYCSTKCRSKFYSKKNVCECRCSYCGNRFTGNRAQSRRFLKSLPVTCCSDCRNKLNVTHAISGRRRKLLEQNHDKTTTL